MCDDDSANSDTGVVIDGDELRISGLQNNVVTDPHVSPDMDTASAMQEHAQALTARKQERKELQKPIQQSPHRVFVHGSLRVRQSTRFLLFELSQLPEGITC
jgi:capsular polysaccharide biosynthesis protein